MGRLKKSHTPHVRAPWCVVMGPQGDGTVQQSNTAYPKTVLSMPMG